MSAPFPEAEGRPRSMGNEKFEKELYGEAPRRQSYVRRLAPARRVMFYSHDTYGLGHIRRTLCLVGALLAHEQKAEVLLATGSPVIDRLAIPPGVRLVQLKPVVKTAAETYEA